jgi:POT family proton-dependent oligopeptide transporter
MNGIVAVREQTHIRPRELLGHPAGLAVLFETEMWERFSYYGMRALLVLYLTKYLLLPGHVENVWGYGAIKGFFESLAGPLDVQPLSSLIYGSYTGLIYFTPLPGGWLADRVMGQKRVVVLGIVMMACGHFMMASERLLFPALFLLIVGGGIFKPNTTGQVGSLYAAGDHRRDRAYSIFYVGTNIGSFLAPLVCGTLGEEAGWHYGFAAAGVGMLFALAIYLIGFSTLPEDELTKERVTHTERPKLTKEDKRAVWALIFLCIPLTLWWACYEQQGNVLNLWTADNTNRGIDLYFWRGEIPVTWFQSVNPFMIFAFTPFLLGLWTRQAAKGTEPPSLNKIMFGCLCQMAGYLVLASVAAYVGDTGKASWLWLPVFIGLVTIGELYLSPISTSLYSKLAPPQILSTMMAVNFIPNFLGGGLLQGWLGAYWSSMPKAEFFLMIAIISGISGIIVWSFHRPLKSILKEEAA